MEVDKRPRRGIIFILSGPSGAGKTTISRAALTKIDGLEMSVSVTTRPPRAGEKPGLDYHFVSDAEFQRRAKAGEFAEFAEVFQASYGTPRGPLDRAISCGGDVLLDIDIQGARQIRACYPHDAVGIFVLPRSFAELAERLRGRGTESPAEITRRLNRARDEASAFPDYDYLIVNVSIAVSLARLAAIVDTERMRVSRLVRGFVPWKA
jgi:guanylate kinase